MSMTPEELRGEATLFGHPTGLYTLFFAEMWERFSYYGMRALLILYMTKGFLKYGDAKATGIYGAYGALVYATPFIGGMLADRLLGERRAVILGGLLMAAGHLAMTIETEIAFFMALALLICGNGFFKPNISTIVGTLYPKASAKKDAGFTVFYLGINLGAAMSPLLCAYVGENYGYHYGFGLATIGMLIGLAVFVAPTKVTQALILGGALTTAASMPFLQDTTLQFAVRIFMSVALATAGIVAFVALSRGGLPEQAGRAPSPKRMQEPAFPQLRDNAIPYYLAIVAAVLALNNVAGSQTHEAWMVVCAAVAFIALPWVSAVNAVYLCTAAAIPIIALVVSRSAIAGIILGIFGALALGSLLRETWQSTKVERDRMLVVFVLMLFSMLFWALFEQAGSSMNLFTDRNIDRAFEVSKVTEAQVGDTIQFRIPLKASDEKIAKLPLLGQEQLGYANGDNVMQDQIARAIRSEEKKRGKLKPAEIDTLVENVKKQGVLTITSLTYLRDAVTGEESSEKEKANKKDEPAEKEKKEDKAGKDGKEKDKAAKKAKEKAEEKIAPVGNVVQWKVVEGNVGMGVAESEIPAAEFQAVNPIYILLFGLIFSALWGFLGRRGLDPNPPLKFALGVFQLGLGFVAVWYGAQQADDRGMVWMGWLLLGYLLHTTGELCLSPVGLSMVTKLSPSRMVATVMGAWFLVTGFSNYLAGFIAGFTAVEHKGDGPQIVPPPKETVETYGDVFLILAWLAIGASIVCLALAPLLNRWMHPEAPDEVEGPETKPQE